MHQGARVLPHPILEEGAAGGEKALLLLSTQIHRNNEMRDRGV